MTCSFRVGAALALLMTVAGCGSDDDGNAGNSGGTAGSTGGSGGSAASGGAGGSAGSGGQAGSGGAVVMPCTAPPRQLWTWDLGVMPPVDIQVPATCRAETPHAYIYVADESWGTDMTQEQVDAIGQAFDGGTPADASKGIYAIDVDTFGEPPDVDGDPRVILFYVPMSGFQGFTFDGFFRDLDQDPGANSNQTEMLHINSRATNKPESDYMLGVVAHEFVHLLSSQYDSSEEGWLNEALAEVAMVKAGYLTDLPAAQAYAKKTAQTPLCVASYSSYGATFSWGAYTLDRFGDDFLKAVLQDPAHGRTSIEAHLPSGLSFRDVFGEFMVANLIDQPGIGDGRYGYSSVDLSAIGSELNANMDGASHDVNTVAFGARMLRFTPSGAGTLSVSLSAATLSQLVVHSVVFDPAAPAGAVVTAHDTGTLSALSLPVGAGQVAVLVLAVDAGNALASGNNPPSTTISYTATFSP